MQLTLEETMMWHVPVAAQNVDPVFLVLFFIVWSALAGTYVNFYLRFAPAALRRWADAEGYKLLEQRKAGMFESLLNASGSGHLLYRVVVRDRKGLEYQGLIRVGTAMHWFWTSSDQCPVEVRWMRESIPLV